MFVYCDARLLLFRWHEFAEPSSPQPNSLLPVQDCSAEESQHFVQDLTYPEIKHIFRTWRQTRLSVDNLSI